MTEAWQRQPVKRLAKSGLIQAIAVLPQGLEEIGAEELIKLGAKQVQPLRRAAAFEADMACLYPHH